MKIQLKMVLYIGMAFLTGCSSLNAQFDCPMKPGIRCESIDSINARVDRGELGQPEIKNIMPTASYTPINYKSNFNFSKRNYAPKGEPVRYSETVTRVWVAPYEDTAGNYHQESEIYTISKPGHWIGYPLKATLGNEG